MKTGRFDMAIYPSTHKTLLERIQSGDEVSWREFYERYSPAVLQVCSNCGISESEGLDVLQRVMLKFFRNDLAMRFNPKRARFRTYFNQVLRSCIQDFKRKKEQTASEITGMEIPETPVPAEIESLIRDEWKNQMLKEALERLRNQVKPETFLAFQLTAFQGKSVKAAADFIQTDVNMVYVARSRCTTRLREIIAEINREDPELGLNWKPAE